jgi:hypothetical protein
VSKDPIDKNGWQKHRDVHRRWRAKTTGWGRLWRPILEAVTLAGAAADITNCLLNPSISLTAKCCLAGNQSQEQWASNLSTKRHESLLSKVWNHNRIVLRV